MKPPSLHSRPPFSKSLPPTSRKQDAALERDIQKHGFLDPVKCFEDGTIIDGHRRWRIAKRLKRLSRLKRHVMDFPTDVAAELWRVETHMATRAFNYRQRRYLIGRIYHLSEMLQGRRATGMMETIRRNGKRTTLTRKVVIETISRRYEKSPKAIRESAIFVEYLNAICPTVRWEFLAGRWHLSMNNLKQLSNLTKNEQLDAWSRVKASKRPIILPPDYKPRKSPDESISLLAQAQRKLPPKMRAEAMMYFRLLRTNIEKQTAGSS